MIRASYLFVLLISYYTGCFGNPVADKNKILFFLHNYEGFIDTRSSADNESVSRWTVSGKLSSYLEKNVVTFKLDEVKTSLFNGNPNDLHHAKEKEIPEEAKVLLQPFKTIMEEDKHVYIYFNPEEPLWSKNFKRAIASNLYTDILNTEDVIVQERTIYGYCEVSYKLEVTDDSIICHQEINHDKCSQKPEHHMSNVRSAPAPDDFKQQNTKSIKITTFLKKDGLFLPHNVVSTSNLTIKSMPDSPHTQHLDQYQKWDLLTETTVEESLDTSQITDKNEIIYEIGQEPTSGRRKYEKDYAVITKEFLDNFNRFEKYFINSSLEHKDMNKHNQVANMYYILQHLDVEGFEYLEKELFKGEDNHNLHEMFLGLLPYTGTDEFVKYFIKIINTDKWSNNEIMAARILSTFPTFIEHPSEKLLEELELLMNLNNVNQQSTQNAGVLSFASVISETYKKNPLFSKQKLKKYINLYHDKFLGSENYNDRMVHLLGLVNMADTLDVQLINNIITNKTESKHIRLLALFGFRTRLAEEPSGLFIIYWPIVQDENEPFEVRVGALDLLLNIGLTNEQLNTIIKKYSLNLENPQDKQLANYLVTSLHSLQNSTAFYDPLGAQASEALKTIDIPNYYKLFATSNYRVSHSDSNNGILFQARVITDPATNNVNVIELTYDSYRFSYNLGTYIVYLNMHGVVDTLSAEIFLSSVKDTSTVEELLKVLEENNFEMKTDNKDVHMEIVVSLNNVAFYAVHAEILDKTELFRIKEDLEHFLSLNIHTVFPVVDKIYMPSSFGTPLQLTNLMEDTMIYYMENFNKYINFRSIWNYQTWLESYNPLVDTKIANYKFIGINTALNFTFKLEKSTLTWLNQNDSFSLYWDNFVGTAVEDEDILQEYCKACKAHKDVSTDIVETNTIDRCAFGFRINETILRHTELENKNNITIFLFFADYQSNIDAHPFAAPLTFVSYHFHNELLFNNDLARGSLRSLPAFEEDTQSTISYSMDRQLKDIQKMGTHIVVKMKNIIASRNDVSSYWGADFVSIYDSEYIDESGQKYVVHSQKFDVIYSQNSSNESYSHTATFNRKVLFPSLRNDKYSLSPVQPAIGNIEYTFLIHDGDLHYLTKQFNITETFSASDKTKKLEDKQNKQDYDQCLASSKDLKFVPPTSECKRISTRLTEYDNYNLHLSFEILSNVQNISKKFENPLIEYSRDGNNYLKFAFLKPPTLSSYYNKTFYYPRPVVNSLTYGDTLLGMSSCTITPATIEQFSEKSITNNKKEWLAFAECFQKSTRGLTGHTIDKTNVGFTYYSKNNIITATLKNGKPEITFNGKELYGTYIQEDTTEVSGDIPIKVYFLDDNAFYIIDNSFEIWYNTEYVQVKIPLSYRNFVCGLCTKDQ